MTEVYRRHALLLDYGVPLSYRLDIPSIQWLVFWLIRSFARSPVHCFVHLFIRPFVCSSIGSPVQLVRSPVPSSVHLFIDWFTCSLVRPPVHSFTLRHTYSFGNEPPRQR